MIESKTVELQAVEGDGSVFIAASLPSLGLENYVGLT